MKSESNILTDCNTSFVQAMSNENEPIHHKIDDNRDEIIFYRNPMVLFVGRNWRKFWPRPYRMKQNQICNSLIRFSIYLFVILAVATGSLKSAVFPITLAVCIAFSKLTYNSLRLINRMKR